MKKHRRSLPVLKYSFQNLRNFPKRNRVIVFTPGKNSIAERKDVFYGKHLEFPGKRQKERIEMSNSNNNQLNIPQAREAMDKFKMQAAQDLDVSFTS